MVTISHLVKKKIEDKPFLQEALRRKLINYGALADELKPEIEKELQKKVKHSAVMMALRRLADQLKVPFQEPQSFPEFSDPLL